MTRCRYSGDSDCGCCLPEMREGTCPKCHGLIMEPGKAYGYAGKVCHCEWKPPREETTVASMLRHLVDNAKEIHDLRAQLSEAQKERKDSEETLTFIQKLNHRLAAEKVGLSSQLSEAQGRIKRLEKDCERERMRLAACGVAALGYFEECHEDYYSASLQDTLRLREEVEKLRSDLADTRKRLSIAIRALRDAHGAIKCAMPGVAYGALWNGIQQLRRKGVSHD